MMAMNEVNPLSFIRRVIPDTAAKTNAETFKAQAASGIQQNKDLAAGLRNALTARTSAGNANVSAGYGRNIPEASLTAGLSKEKLAELAGVNATTNKAISDTALNRAKMGLGFPSNASMATRADVNLGGPQVVPLTSAAALANNLSTVDTDQKKLVTTNKSGVVTPRTITKKITRKGSANPNSILIQGLTGRTPAQQPAPAEQTMVNTSGVTDPLMLSGIEFAKQKYGSNATIIPTSEGVKVTTRDASGNETGNFLLRKENIAKAIGQ